MYRILTISTICANFNITNLFIYYSLSVYSRISQWRPVNPSVQLQIAPTAVSIQVPLFSHVACEQFGKLSVGRSVYNVNQMLPRKHFLCNSRLLIQTVKKVKRECTRNKIVNKSFITLHLVTATASVTINAAFYPENSFYCVSFVRCWWHKPIFQQTLKIHAFTNAQFFCVTSPPGVMVVVFKVPINPKHFFAETYFCIILSKMAQ